MSADGLGAIYPLTPMQQGMLFHTLSEPASALYFEQLTCTLTGELDDQRFARRYAEDKRELRGWGPERIREALTSRGVASDLVEMALEADSHDAQVRRASDLLARRGRPLDVDSDRARALGYLTRRGYEYEVAYEAVRTAAARAS